MFSMKINSVSYTVAMRRLSPPGVYDLSDHSSLVVGDRERGMVLDVPKDGNVMTQQTLTTLTRDSKMDADDVTNKLETGDCLLVVQEVKGKSDVWNICDQLWKILAIKKNKVRSRRFMHIMSLPNRCC